jgi:type I restriction enzyme S subunit
MQELLTTKRRLKGFTWEWNSVKLGDVLEYRQPTKYLVSSKEYTTQGVPVLTAGKTFILGYTQENWGLYDDLPVIIFDDFVVESKYVTMPFKVKSSAIKMLSLREKENDLRFIFEKMQCIEFSIADHKRHWISEYSQLEITIPEPNEQCAIANILSSMDTEITNLEQKRDKYIAIKQGMMQNLLTGKIRLI